jgi:antibiotic biosynthesis monooxygenase (ABM) superfamily enzyme
MSTEAVTVVITRVVRRGAEEAFEQAVRDWIPKALAYSGHLGVLMLRPAPGGREYGAVIRFRTQQEWEAFRDSPEYRAFLENLRQYLEADQRVETTAGLEAWLAPLGATFARVPPRWKSAILTWIGVSITAFILRQTLTPQISEWHIALGFLTFNAAMVACLTWLVMPTLGKLAHPWLHGSTKT